MVALRSENRQLKEQITLQQTKIQKHKADNIDLEEQTRNYTNFKMLAQRIKRLL